MKTRKVAPISPPTKSNSAPSVVHYLDRVDALNGHAFLASPRIATRIQGLIEHLGRGIAVIVFHSDAGNLVKLGVRVEDFKTLATLSQTWMECSVGWSGKGFRGLLPDANDFEAKISKSDKASAQIQFGDNVSVSIVVDLYTGEDDKTSSPDNKNIDLRYIRGELQEKLHTFGVYYVEDFLGGASAQSVKFPIDIVYTWVNDEDPDWQEIYAVAKGERDAELLAQHLEHLSDQQSAQEIAETPLLIGPLPEVLINDADIDQTSGANETDEEDLLTDEDQGPEEATDTAAMSRFKNRQELRYSLRSVEQYLPWVRKIFIFTNCAKPAWLQETDNVIWVRHEDVIPAKHLPTFNSHAIESYLHKIPDLSEHFIYFNDDFFVNQSLPVSLFFTANGVAQSNLEDYGVVNGVQAEGDADYLNAARNGVDLLRKEFGMVPTRLHKHSPYAMSKSVMAEMEKKFKAGFERTRAGKFRSSSDLSTASFLFHHYGYATRAVAYAGFRAKLVKNTARNLTADFKMMTEGTSVRTFCLNDGHDSHDDETWNTMICEFLEQRFPLMTRAEMGMPVSGSLSTDDTPKLE